MNVFGMRAGRDRQAQPWSETLTFGGNIRDFYESRGDATISSPTEIVTVLDGPEKVVRYGNLTVSSTLTASQRCKGLTIICDSLTVNSGGVIAMTARGCRVDRSDDPRYPFIDFLIPNKIGLSSDTMTRKRAMELISTMGLAPWDRGFWDSDGGSLGLLCSIAEIGSTTLMSVLGCAAGAAAQQSPQPGSVAGLPGNAGTGGGTGSGGQGGLVGRLDGSGYPAYHFPSGCGSVYGGGNGTSGLSAGTGYGQLYDAVKLPVHYSFKVGDAQGPGGGGAGVGAGLKGNAPWGGSLPYDGGEGTGGKLLIICYGNVTINSGGKIEANGMPGGNAGGPVYGAGGGGSGGGHVSIVSAGTYANSGTVQAAGGAGGAGYSQNGGSGGAGSVVTKTFAQMGWS